MVNTITLSCIDEDLFDKLNTIKSQLNYSKKRSHFENKLHMINDTWVPYGIFMKVYVIQKQSRTLDQANQLKNYYYFSINPKSAFVAYYDQGKKTKQEETFQCHYCDVFFRCKKKYKKHIKRCTGHSGFVYCFQYEILETYEKYLKHKKDFSFMVVVDLETTTKYISEMEGGSMFATSYCLMSNFHPKLKMTPTLVFVVLVKLKKN